MGKISGSRILRSRPNTMLGQWRGSWGLRGRGGGGDKMWTHHWSNQEKDALCRGAGVCWGHVTPVWPVAAAPPAGPPACWQCPDGRCSSEPHTGSPLQRATTHRGGGETHKDQATKRKKRKKEQEREKKHRKTEGGREKKNNFQPKVMTFSFQRERHWLWNWFWQVLGQRFSTGGLWSCSDWATALWTVSILFFF